ncbi:PepSY domain-containing protein [Ferdinandcohnia quinoae]|uniref:PepSY domain-containing protein n=1 Tax=Fredinandcohnia quinoae TaxID=2918902 RepID=A0AAW5E3I2_9BACI|nr:PepSY domain-containing protein [Fredinandcohnia sp. SECRCQ15]
MSWKKFILGVGVGFAGALIVKEALKQYEISGEKALKLVKEEFKKNGPIDGSWIQMEPESYIKSEILYKVYKGGISRTVDMQDQHYEFIVDAKTGTILEVSPL